MLRLRGAFSISILNANTPKANLANILFFIG
jgi:hypothetical protein